MEFSALGWKEDDVDRKPSKGYRNTEESRMDGECAYDRKMQAPTTEGKTRPVTREV